jgi:hypothetical protein
MRNRRRKGGILAKVLLGLGLLFGMLIVCLIFLCFYIAHNVHVEESNSRSGKTLRVDTPLGSVNMQDHGNTVPKDLGVPPYPGATPMPNGGKSVNLDLKLGSETHYGVVVIEYTTPDSPEQVAGFYRKELPQWTVENRHGGRVQMTHLGNGCKRIVTIHGGFGHTRITMAQIGEPRVN